MFRANLCFDEKANLDSEVDALRAGAARAGLSGPTIDQLIHEFRGVLAPLINGGQLLKQQGSRLAVDRTIAGKGYSVKLAFGVGRQLGLLDRLVRLLKGQ